MRKRKALDGLDPRRLHSSHPGWVFISALVGSMIGYVVYNTGIVFGFFKTSQIGVFGCLQSFGTIGCGDTVNGFVYSVMGGMLAGLLVWAIKYKIA